MQTCFTGYSSIRRGQQHECHLWWVLAPYLLLLLLGQLPRDAKLAHEPPWSVAIGCILWPTLTASLSIAIPASALKRPGGSAKVLFSAFFANGCFQPAAIKASSTDLHTLVLLTEMVFQGGTSFLTLCRALSRFPKAHLVLPIVVSIESLEQVLLGWGKRVTVGNLVLKSTSP